MDNDKEFIDFTKHPTYKEAINFFRFLEEIMENPNRNNQPAKVDNTKLVKEKSSLNTSYSLLSTANLTKYEKILISNKFYLVDLIFTKTLVILSDAFNN